MFSDGLGISTSPIVIESEIKDTPVKVISLSGQSVTNYACNDFEYENLYPSTANTESTYHRYHVLIQY